MDVELMVSGLSGLVSFRPRGAAPVVLAAVVVLPIALVLASGRWHGRGPTWAELLAPLRQLVPWDTLALRRRRFAWPVRVSVDRLYGLLLTGAGEVVLVSHDRHDQRPYHTLPGGTIQRSDECPEDVMAHALGAAAARGVDGWALIHVDRRARHQELVYAGAVAPHHVEAARAATRHHLQLVPLTPEAIAHLDLHPHAVAEVVRRLAAERQRPPG